MLVNTTNAMNGAMVTYDMFDLLLQITHMILDVLNIYCQDAATSARGFMYVKYTMAAQTL